MRVNLLFLFLLCSILTGCREKKVQPRPPKTVEVAKVVESDVQLYNTYVGHVQASVQVEVKAQVEGVLLRTHFIEGQEVKAGDPLFSIDPRPFEAELSKAKAALAKSLVNLRYAKDVATRNEPLAEENYVSKLQYDEYLTEVMDYEAQVKENQAEVQSAEIDLSYCSILSPIDAVTGVLKIQEGNLIQNAQNNPLIILNKISPAYTYFSVPQKDLPRIMKLHREEQLQVVAYLGEEKPEIFQGKLDLIDNQLQDAAGSIWLRGIFANEQKLLWPGEFVKVHLLLEKVQNALLIPEEAVSIGQKGKYVYVLRSDSTVELRHIEAGMRFENNMRLITKGLNPGDTVVTLGQINLKNGDKVEVKSK